MAQEKSDKAGREAVPPVYKTKCGRVHVAVWEQETSTGSMLTVTLKRTYKTDAGFRDAFNFALSDLDDIARAFEDVKTWARTQGRED